MLPGAGADCTLGCRRGLGGDGGCGARPRCPLQRVATPGPGFPGQPLPARVPVTVYISGVRAPESQALTSAAGGLPLGVGFLGRVGALPPSDSWEQKVLVLPGRLWVGLAELPFSLGR